MVRVEKSDVGRMATVIFNCVGHRDGLIVGIDEDKKYLQFFEFGESLLRTVSSNQVTALGKRLHYIGWA